MNALASCVFRLGLAGLIAAAPQAAAAQAYPSKPVRILVSIPPGGAPDIAARVLGEKLGPRLGQPVVVENRPGANGNLAGDLVAKAAPDGHTLILAADSLIAINPHLYSKMPFDTLNDLVPVASVASNQFVLSVNPKLPVRDFKEFIEHARKAEPKLSYASGGVGSQHQLAMEMLKARAGIDLLHVPYRGGSPATVAAVAGEVSAMFAGTSSAPQIKAGALRALAVTGRERSRAFPDVPTIGEFYPGYEVTIWLGLFAPAGTPEPVLAKLREDIAAVLADRWVRERFEGSGSLEPYASSAAEFAALIRRDHAKYGALVRAIGIKPE